MNNLSATRAADRAAILHAARNGTLVEPEGEVPDDAIPVFFRVGDEIRVEWLTPREHAFMKARARLDAADRRNVDRMIDAMAAGVWPVASGEFAKMTPAQQQAVFDSLPA